MSKERTQVFVYGTLMPGQARWAVLEPFAVTNSRATARGDLWDTGLGYPAAVFHSGRQKVPGFVVVIRPELTADAIRELDEIEGEGELFRRTKIRTSAGQAVSYEWLGSTEALLPLPDGWPPVGR